MICFLLMSCMLTTNSYSSATRIPSEQFRKPTKAEQLRMEGYMNYFSFVLFRYVTITGEYPSGMSDLIRTGLLTYWPINPVTGKPVRVLNDIREGDFQFAGDITYEYDSPKAGRFKGIFYTSRSHDWKYFKFPEVIDQDLLEELIKKDPKSFTEEPEYRFSKSMVGLFGALKDIHLDNESRGLPDSIEALLSNHFRILSEFYLPVYTGDDPDEGGFYELGVDRQSGFWYSIYNIRPDYTYRFAHKWPHKGLPLTEREFEDKRFPDLPHKTPLLASYMYPTAAELPTKVQMSIDDIEYVRRR